MFHKIPVKFLEKCSKIRRQLHSSLKTKHKPVELAYTTYENTKTHTESDPPPLIVTHGLFGSKTNWNSLCKVFHQQTLPQRKIIATDLRNHGDSPHTTHHNYEALISDLKLLYERLDLKKASLLGHSMGGRAMMYFALKYPELVEKLIVADISPIRTSSNLKLMLPLFDALRNVQLPGNVALSIARADVDQQLVKRVSDNELRGFLLKNLTKSLDGSYIWRINIPVLLSNFKNIANFPDCSDLEFDGPVLFLGGSKSDFLTPQDHPQILKLFPKAQFHYIEGAGHWLHSEKPIEFIQQTIDFLNRKPTN